MPKPTDAAAPIESQSQPIDIKDFDQSGRPDDDLAGAEGWDEESAGAPVQTADDDSTAHDGTAPDAGAGRKVDAQADQVDRSDQDDDGQADDGDDAADDQAATSEKPKAKAADAKADAATPKKKGKDAVSQRESRLDELQRDINASTYTKHQLQRDIADLEARRAALSSGQPAQPGSAPAQTQSADAAQKADDLPPMQPSYADFSEEEEYQQAMQQWQKDMVSWSDRRIATGLETRMSAREQRDARMQAEREFASRMQATSNQHDDFGEAIEAVGSLASPWAAATPEKYVDIGPDGREMFVPAPFLWDVIRNSQDGPEVLYYLGTHAEEAQALAELQPTTPIADAIIRSPSPVQLMAYFATPQGRQHFDQLKAMHPVVLNQQIGLLTAQVSAAPSGPTGPAPQPITAATPHARPPRGAPRAQARTSQEGNFDIARWIEETNESEAAAARRRLQTA